VKVFVSHREQTRVFFVTAKAPRFALSFFFSSKARSFFCTPEHFFMKTLNFTKKSDKP